MIDFRIADIDFEIDSIDMDKTGKIFDDFKTCPHCCKAMTGRPAILSFFGERRMGSGKVYYQSWCKPCRNFRPTGGMR